MEARERVLARVAGRTLSRWFEAEHRAHGVDLRLGATVVCIEEKGGRACGVRLEGGEELGADMVIVGVGLAPCVEPLLAAGAKDAGLHNGVLVDLHGRTSLPDVYAVGDCAAHANVHAGGAVVRLESVQNAIDQATLVAKVIAARHDEDDGAADRTVAQAPYTALPWFWSHQYDLRLQTVGLSLGHDEVIVRGVLAHDAKAKANGFAVVYLRAGKVIALDCVNASKDYLQGRALVSARYAPDDAGRAKLADAAVPLKSLLA